MGLQSELLRGDPKLEAAAVSDPAHITPGASGPHVGKVQTALILLDDAPITDDELQKMAYGPSTAGAVLTYKRKRRIINQSYQTQADDIVGKMTIASLDNELLKAPPAEPVQIRALSFSRLTRPPHPLVAALLADTQRSAVQFAAGSMQLVSAPVTAPQINPQTTLELRRQSRGRFEVTNGSGGTVQVRDPGIAKIRAADGRIGTSFVIKKKTERFEVVSGKSLGRTLIIATASGLSSSLDVVVKPFGGPPNFHEGVRHDHTPSRRWEEVLHHPNNSGSDSLKKALDVACAALAAAADAPIPLPHGPELLVATARALLFVKRPLGSKHLEFYLSGGGADFVEDSNITDWITRDSGIRHRLKREIFPAKGKTRTKGEFFFHQREYAKDEAGQDFRFAFGSIDKVDFEVDLADHLVRVWFKDRYEWHPFYPKLYKVKPGDAARDDNCVHAAMVEMQDQGAADYWMKGVAEVPLSLIAAP
jgi:peptidoglycan hydrolase-like protein with peptidoglycan-binding domain